MKKIIKFCTLIVALLSTFAISPVLAESTASLPVVSFADLPASAQKTVRLIKQNGPFPYEKDGVVFGNYEHILPYQKRGYYHEYTVPTAGAKNRGAQRIIVGGKIDPAHARFAEMYYTSDHYASFKRIVE